jgi:peptide deformylase
MSASIVQAGTAVLRERAVEIPPEKITSPEIRGLIEAMIAAMRAAPGVGLAAPQLGIPLRVFVVEDRDELARGLSDRERDERERVAVPVRVFVNPTVRPIGEEKVGFFEGCLSVRGYVGYVERWREVEVSALDENAQPQTWRVRGWPARILQHEMDHLEGTLYIDRMDTRTFAEQEIARDRFAGKSMDEVRALLGLS